MPDIAAFFFVTGSGDGWKLPRVLLFVVPREEFVLIWRGNGRKRGFTTSSAMKRIRFLAIPLVLLVSIFAALAQRQMEQLGRGVVAVRTGTSTAYVGWRLLGTDPENIGFNVLRSVNGATPVQRNGALLTSSCNFTDPSVNFAQSNAYFLQPVVAGVTQALSAAFGMPANIPTQQYLNIPLQKPADGTNASGPYTYNANDCSAADLDRDGEYEIILKWDPSNAKDNSQSGFTGNVLLDAYKLDGTLLWRVDLGPNIRAGAHYTQFMVYDLDGDGRAELACKTAPGTKDGLGNYVDGNASFTVYTNSGGYILSGPEYFTIFDGLTGGKLAHTNYLPGRGNVSDWGDSYGNRVDRFLAAVAYLDGVRPSVVMCRGYYTRAALVAWDWRNGQLTQRWTFDTGHSGGPWANYKGQGAHSLTVGDVDADGKDEIIYGACTIDDNGTGLYTTGLAHGDALHLSDMEPQRPGQEVWMIHESPSQYGPYGLEMHDARTGEILVGVDGQNADIGRGVAYDLDPRYRGYELWGSRGGLMSATGVEISSAKPSQANFCAWWDADTLRESLDGTTVRKWDWNANANNSILSPGGLSSNNGTKSTPALSADLFGDWREEIIWRTSDNQNLRIYTTTTVATNRLVTLMHDPQYRVAIAWQNVAYNQPPHPGYFIGAGMYPPPVPPISNADLVWRGGGANTWDAGVTANWRTNGVWKGANPAVPFLAGRSVLFDATGSNHTSVVLSGNLSPAQVMVHAARDYVFSGSGSLVGGMSLRKAGVARLTVQNTNHYTGATVVSGGTLFLNGTLSGSAVTVERRGTPEGPSRFGGAGQLGNGLTVQAGCVLTVGPETNAPGVLAITNGLTLLGSLNQFDLSSDSTGLTRTNDLVVVQGNLTLSGTNLIEVNPLDGSLEPGIYPLIKYTGALSGGLGNLVLAGNFIQEVVLTNPPGMIALVASISPAPPVAPGNLTAVPAGALQINLSWQDNSADEIAFLIERSLNNITFGQIAMTAPDATSYVDTSVAPDTTYYYRVRGTNLAGFSDYSNVATTTTTPLPNSLTWRGGAAANTWDIGGAFNWSDGANLVVYSDGANVLFDQSGSNNTPVLLEAVLQPDSVVVNASKNYTFNTGTGGSLAGAMTLTKQGSGTVFMNVSNSFSGGVDLNAGQITLGNIYAAGTGPLRFNGGTLTLAVGSQQTYGNPLVINSNSTILSQGGNNNIVSGAWSGNAATTLTITASGSPGVFTVNGNMNNFLGTVSMGNSSGTFRFNSSGNTAFGSPNTTYDLGTGTAWLVNRNGGITVTLGALAGGPNTTLAGRSSGSGGSGSTYQIGGNHVSTTFSGRIINGNDTTTITKVGSGTLTLAGTNSYTGPTAVSAGRLLVNGDQSAATNAVSVAVGATLGGAGIIGGATTIHGTLAPGVALGTLTFTQSLAFSTTGRAQFEISKNPLSADQAVVTGAVTYTGTLDVVNTSVELLEAGDNFQLFSAGSYQGAFTEFALPALEAGLTWNASQLATNGRIWVVSTVSPVIDQFSLTGGNFSFSGSGGTPNWNFMVLTATNLALPVSSWTEVATGQFDGAGDFEVLVPIAPGEPQRYYLLRSE
jgi:autotransporter-associated beta strand protein